jgi:hypothetical protein
MLREKDIEVGSVYKWVGPDGREQLVTITDEDSNYYFIQMGSAGLGIPKDDVTGNHQATILELFNSNGMKVQSRRPTPTQIVRAIHKSYVLDTGDTMINDGMWFRYNKEAKEHGTYYVEVGNSYYYRSQANVEGVTKMIEVYAQEHNWDIRLEYVSNTVRFEQNDWAKESWKKAIYRITFV